MARTSRLKKNAPGTAHYHLMSQTNDKKFLFEEGRIKDSLIDALKRAAEFSGVRPFSRQMVISSLSATGSTSSSVRRAASRCRRRA